MSSHDPFAPSSAVPPEGAKSKKSKAAEAPVEDVKTAAQDAAPADAEKGGDAPEVPEGTTKEVVDWVGGDKARAQAALDAENATGEPRKGLVKELTDVLEAE